MANVDEDEIKNSLLAEKFSSFDISRALAAGARQVVASLWHVSDESTSELMTDFYKRLAEDAAAGRPLRVAESLHAAKRHLRQSADWNSPAHWASFVFVGPVK